MINLPYIEKEKRLPIDQLVEPLIIHLRRQPLEEQDGSFNYTLTKMLKELYPLRYYHLNRGLGVLTAVHDEFYRRWVAPYEDVKKFQNGDVY